MDVEKLIGSVFEVKTLWDMKDKNYHNRDISRQNWRKIAEEMNTTSESVKTKWRGLRDTFRKELNKLTKSKSGSEGGLMKESTWPYFQSMTFLKDQFQKRKLDGNVPSCSWYQSDNELNDDDDMVIIMSPDDTCQRENDQNSQTNNMDDQREEYVPIVKKSRTKSDAVEKLLEIEEKKLNMFQRRNEDADYHFLMSLLPSLRNVPEHRKMIVRTKLQQVFCEETSREC